MFNAVRLRSVRMLARALKQMFRQCCVQQSNGWTVLCPRKTIQSQTSDMGGKTLSVPAHPRVVGLKSGLGCGLGFAFGKSLGRLQNYPRVNLSVLGTTLG